MCIRDSLCTCQRSSVGQAFSCQNTLIYAFDSLVLTEQITDLSCAGSDVTSRYVCVCADIFAELCHKALAECHNLAVRFSLGIEIGAALAATDRQACQGVFEYQMCIRDRSTVT